MRTILFQIQKEFLQIFRNKTMLPIIIFVPFVQFVILVSAATMEMKNIKMAVVNNSTSQTAKNLVQKFSSSPFYTIEGYTSDIETARLWLHEDIADVILNIPDDFGKSLIKEKSASVQILINAINGMSAGLINAYTSAIIADFNKEFISVNIQHIDMQPVKTINVIPSYWYNPDLNYKIFMVPGILVILITIIGMFLSALNLVREKEIGTIEQINVTPVKKSQFLAGKLFPFWIIALFELGFGLILGVIFFGQPVEGSLGILYLIASIYLLVMMGIGLFISTISNSQQQVMFMTFFFLLTFILMSGIFTPVESMPLWAQRFNIVNPLAYFMRAIRMILLKGSGFFDILDEMVALSIFAVLILGFSVLRYRKVA